MFKTSPNPPNRPSAAPTAAPSAARHRRSPARIQRPQATSCSPMPPPTTRHPPQASPASSAGRMSQSSSRSASSSQGGGGGGYEGQGSPVAYRTGPLAYEPGVKCKCDAKSCRWISWSTGQPGRRYYRCMKARTNGDCGFFSWLDEECSPWYKEVIRDLRDAVWGLKRELIKKDGDLEAKDTQLVAMQMLMEEKKKEVEDMLKAKEEQLKVKEDAIKTLQAQVEKLVLLCVLLLMTMVVILFNGK